MIDYDKAIDLDINNIIAYYNRGLLRAYVGDNMQAGKMIQYKAHVHWCIFFLGVLSLCIVILLRGLYLKIGTHYVVTNKRVILKQGVLSRNAMELRLIKSGGLIINQGLIGQLLGFEKILLTIGRTTNV